MSSGTRTNVITLAILVAVLAVLAPHAPQLNWTAERVAGAAIVGLSLTAIFIARFQLGSAFSLQARAEKLVKSGIYAKIRNPIYVFGEFFCVGVALLSGRWWIVIVGAALIPVQMWRARNEACVLRAKFGEEYDRYRAQTWF